MSLFRSERTVLNNAYDADLASLDVKGNITPCRVSITRPADTQQYAIGEAWADKTSEPTVPSFVAARANGKGGALLGLKLILSANQTTKLACKVLVYDTTYTALEDNAAVDLSAAEAARLVGIFDVLTSDWIVTNAGAGALGNVSAYVKPIDNSTPGFTCLADSKNLYPVVYVNNTYTPISGEVLTLIFDVLPN